MANEHTNESTRTGRNERTQDPKLGCDCDECGEFISDGQMHTNAQDRVVCQSCLVLGLTHISNDEERQAAIAELAEVIGDMANEDMVVDFVINGCRGYDRMTNQELFAELVSHDLIDESADRVQAMREELIEHLSGPDIDMATTIRLYAVVVGG